LLRGGKRRTASQSGLILALREQGEGDAKENTDYRGTNETDREEMEEATDARPLGEAAAAGS